LTRQSPALRTTHLQMALWNRFKTFKFESIE